MHVMYSQPESSNFSAYDNCNDMLAKLTVMKNFVDTNIKEMEKFRRDAYDHIAFLTKRLDRQHQTLQMLGQHGPSESKLAEMYSNMKALIKQYFMIQKLVKTFMAGEQKGASGPPWPGCGRWTPPLTTLA